MTDHSSHHEMLRRAQQPMPVFDRGSMMRQPQQQGRQLPDAGADHPQLVECATSAEEEADLKSALNDPTGSPRPVYDQYFLNSPRQMHGEKGEEAASPPE